MVDRQKTSTSNYPLQGALDNTANVKIEAVEKILGTKISGLENLLVEKEKALLHRIEMVENGESDKKDRIFQWKTLLAGVFFGSIGTYIVGVLIK